MKWIILFLLMSGNVFALGNTINDDYLKPEDQKYYKNEYGTGMNQLERIDSTVKEINKLHGEIASMKAEIQSLKKEVEELKKK